MADRRTTKEAAGSKNQLKERSIDRKGDQEARLWSFVGREAVEVQLLDKNIAGTRRRAKVKVSSSVSTSAISLAQSKG
jgi:hypothetical protein